MPVRPTIHKRRILRTVQQHLPFGWKLHDEIRSVLHNGVGRYVPQLARITFTFSPKHSDSAYVRHYIQNELIDFARRNPGTSVYVQPKAGSPKIVGEYLNGRQVRKYVASDSGDELAAWVEHLATRSGRRVTVYDSNTHTQYPSIQGVWNPYMHIRTDSILNDVHATNVPPHERSGMHQSARLTATEVVEQIVRDAQNMTISDTTPGDREQMVDNRRKTHDASVNVPSS